MGFRAAWKDYVRNRVVSEHAQRVIRNLLGACTAFGRDKHDDTEDGPAKEEVPFVPGAILLLSDVHELLEHMHHRPSAEAGEEENPRISTSMGKALEKGTEFWNFCPARNRIQLPTDGTGVAGHMSLPEMPAAEPQTERRRGGKTTKPTASLYSSFRSTTGTAWFEKTLHHPTKTPSAEQEAVLRRVDRRCALEAREWHSNTCNRDPDEEPERLMVQGLPGAGKSELIWWLRSYFEEVLGWEHGVQFVCVAWMNTMANLVGGFTTHRFGAVPINKQQGDAAKDAQWSTPDANQLFDRYESLRWVLMDESSSTAVDPMSI